MCYNIRQSQIMKKLIFFFFLSFSTSFLIAQGNACPVSPSDLRSSRPNIFNDVQEMALGDALAEQTEREQRIVHGNLNDYLQKIGERILHSMPSTQLQFKFQLINRPIVNAFTMPGGRIYVTRKLVASARSEDELAGVLAHEIGHAMSRDPSVDMTYLFQKILGVNSLGDRKDVYQKVNLLQENIKTKPDVWRKFSQNHEQDEQLSADKVAIIAASKAGYNPKSYAEFWDRIADTKGKTGNAFSDFFGATSPESKRLRETLKLAQSIPPECYGHEPVDSTAFKNWQADIVENASANRSENVQGLLQKTQLDKPLRNEVHLFRFSPDGKYILSQDGSSVFVLTRQPLKVLFRIHAKGMATARFSTDSASVNLYNRAMRIERWNIASMKRVFVNELTSIVPCANLELSPDGRMFACFTNENNLEILDTNSGASLWKQKNFYYDSGLNTLNSLLANAGVSLVLHGSVPLEFSPDGKYLLALRRDDPFVLEIDGWKKVSLTAPLKDLLKHEFSFGSGDNILSVRNGEKDNAVLARFPSGELIKRFSAPSNNIHAVSNGAYGIMSPAGKYSAAIVDIVNDKIPVVLTAPAVDVYDNEFLSEKKNGEIGIYKLNQPLNTQEVADISNSPLPNLHIFSASSDLHYLLFGTDKRAGLWDLQNNKQVKLLRSPKEAYFAADGFVMLDFAKHDDVKRSLVAMRLSDGVFTEPIEVKDPRTRIIGNYGIVFVSNNKKEDDFSKNTTVNISDMYNNKPLWSKTFPKEMPGITLDPRNHTVVLGWGFSTDAVHEDLKNDPRFAEKKLTVDEKRENNLLHILDADTGNLLGKIIVETGKGSFKIDSATADHDHVILGDNENRVLIYRLSTGELQGRVFGDHPMIAGTSNIFTVWSDSDVLSIYDLNTMDLLNQLSFKSNISAAIFNKDGSQLLVLTDDQTIYLIDPKGNQKSEVANSPPLQ